MGGVQFNPEVNRNYKYSLPENFGYNVGGVNRGTPSTGIGRTQYVESETGDKISSSGKRGFVGCLDLPEMNAPASAGYPPAKLREVCVA